MQIELRNRADIDKLHPEQIKDFAYLLLEHFLKTTKLPYLIVSMGNEEA